MSFVDPLRLVLLAVVAAAIVAYVVLQARRSTYTMRFTNVDLLASVAPRRPGWRRHLPAALFVVAVASMVVAWAGPTAPTTVPVERATVILAIDVSLSMQAQDVEPDRLRAAQAAAQDFLDVVPPELNVGLVTFSGSATIAVPPTTDRDLVAEAVDRLQLAERTAIGEAIFASLDAINLVPTDPGAPDIPAAIVLMSDGATTAGRANELAVAAAVDQGVPVTTIAFGTDEGTITIPGDPIPIPVPVDRAALEVIAADTGGVFFSAVTAQQLEDVYVDIGSSIGFTTAQRDISDWFIAAALVALIATGAMSLAWFSRLP
jgi:Ca-activated chloride channel family protein